MISFKILECNDLPKSYKLVIYSRWTKMSLNTFRNLRSLEDVSTCPFAFKSSPTIWHISLLDNSSYKMK